MRAEDGAKGSESHSEVLLKSFFGGGVSLYWIKAGEAAGGETAK